MSHKALTAEQFQEAWGAKSEREIQCMCVRWARAQARSIPGLGLLFAIPNGGHRVKAVAAKLKSEGVRRGVPDLFLPVPSGEHHGLWIEMKTAKGRLREEQKHWRDELQAQGYAWALCRDLKGFQETVLGYLAPRLYAYGVELPELRWGRIPDGESKAPVSWCGNHVSSGERRPRVGKKAASATPPEFRDVLLAMARSVGDRR